MKIRTMAAMTATIALLAACSKAPEAEGPVTADAAAPAEEHVDHAAPAASAFTRKPSPAGATVFIDLPKADTIVANPVRVVFGLTGMTVAPVDAPAPNAGHHHLLVDTDLADASMPIPADAKHVHFGKGQTETMLELPAGEHTLQLVLADELHVPFEPMVASQKIKIVVR
jgi:hypothetical protein